MTATSKLRGHLMLWEEKEGRYLDIHEPPASAWLGAPRGHGGLHLRVIARYKVTVTGRGSIARALTDEH